MKRPYLRKGLDAVPSVDVRLIAELGRNLGPDGTMRTLEQVADLRALKIVGIGLGGFEPQYPNELFAKAYERSRGLGFPTTAHDTVERLPRRDGVERSRMTPAVDRDRVSEGV